MFYLFCGDNYYPQSGLGDYRGKFSTLDEADAEGKRLKKSEEYGNDWYVIVTVDTDGELREVRHEWR